MDLGIFSALTATITKHQQPQPQQPSQQQLSDEESLDDRCSVEDFQGVTLQFDYSRNHTPVSPASDRLCEDNPTWERERKELLSLSGEKDTMTGELPQISITPMTPPSALDSPGAQSTVSLTSTNPSPLHRPTPKSIPAIGHNQNQYRSTPTSYWGAQTPPEPSNELEAKEFFACRDSIIQNAIDEVQQLVDPEEDGGVRGTWLLTEVDHWDNEKERLVLLCMKTIIIVKYDFIAMKGDDHRRVHLCIVDKIIQGELKYPDRSLTPRLNGIAGGILGVVKGCLVPTVSGTMKSVGNAVLYRTMKNKEAESEIEIGTECTVNENENDLNGEIGSTEEMTSKTSVMSALAMENFEPRLRKVQGIRIMWNQDLPLSFTQRWNPFDKSIPWLTFTSHPLLWAKGGGGGIHRSFDVDSFSREFIDILSSGGGDHSPCCRIEYKPIVMETYVGIASLLHNANDLGFYKVRGRVSF